jgi:hypothetical protein
MPLEDGTEPVANEELIYRRIPESTGWYSPNGISPRAFDPHNTDKTGISLSRAKYKSVEEAARGRPGKSYYVAIFRAGDLRNRGIFIEPRPRPDDPGHAELPDLRADNRKDKETLERMQVLTTLSLEVRGPFPSPEPLDFNSRQ